MNVRLEETSPVKSLARGALIEKHERHLFSSHKGKLSRMSSKTFRSKLTACVSDVRDGQLIDTGIFAY